MDAPPASPVPAPESSASATGTGPAAAPPAAAPAAQPAPTGAETPPSSASAPVTGEPAAVTAPSPATPPATTPAVPAGPPDAAPAPAPTLPPTAAMYREPPISVKERVFHGVPFAVVFIYWVVVACVGLKMEEMFLERNIGRLPGVTTTLFRVIHLCADVPWAFGVVILALAAGYLLWGAQTRERMRWTGLLMQGLLVVLVVITLAALFAPLSMIGSSTR